MNYLRLRALRTHVGCVGVPRSLSQEVCCRLANISETGPDIEWLLSILDKSDAPSAIEIVRRVGVYFLLQNHDFVSVVNELSQNLMFSLLVTPYLALSFLYAYEETGFHEYIMALANVLFECPELTIDISDQLFAVLRYVKEPYLIAFIFYNASKLRSRALPIYQFLIQTTHVLLEHFKMDEDVAKYLVLGARNLHGHVFFFEYEFILFLVIEAQKKLPLASKARDVLHKYVEEADFRLSLGYFEQYMCFELEYNCAYSEHTVLRYIAEMLYVQ